jgi:hypothetical protein
MRTFFYILLLSVLPIVSFSQNSTSPQQMEVMMKMSSLRSALLGKDSVSLSKILADDCSYGHTNGLMQTKAQLIRDIVSGVQNYKSIDPSDMVIKVYDNSAVVTLKSKVKMVYQGNELDLAMNVIVFWVKKKDWVIVGRQSVKLP